jgi:hypothetical protein
MYVYSEILILLCALQSIIGTQLDRLVKICGQNCEESKDLQKAIKVYKAAKSGSGGK